MLGLGKQHRLTLTVNKRKMATMYGKVFQSMYDGTLATIGPWQALVTFQQMIVLADKDGVVDMTANAISRRTSIPLEIIETGIAALTLPDPESRSDAEEGRRIVLLSDNRSWGWQIVNYAYYSALRSAEERREYMRQAQAEHRARVKASKNVMTNSDNAGFVNKSTDVPVSIPVSNTGKSSAQPDGFARFWQAYPKKVNKAQALKAFKGQKINGEIVDILKDIENRRASLDWTKDGGQYVPYPSTYLTNRKWEEAQESVNPFAGAL